MKSYGKNREFCFLIIVLVASAVVAQAAEVNVNCSKKHASINATLATLTKQGPNTIHVSGACKETVIIDGFSDLTLLANPGASINDPTPSILDGNDVVDIIESRNVTVQGFTINGGSSGVLCYQFSVCYLRNLTVQGADTGVVFIWSSSGFVTDTIIQNNAFSGITVTNGSSVFAGPNTVFFVPTPTTTNVTIQNNGTSDGGGTAVIVANGSNLTLNTVTIQNHPYADGVVVQFGSFLRLAGSTITGSGGDGVRAQSSVLRFLNNGTTGNTITNNGGNGVNVLDSSSLYTAGATTITGNGANGIHLRHLSFLNLGGARTISGNGGPDVNCSVTTAKTTGTGGSGTPNLGGGTTNCTEPAP